MRVRFTLAAGMMALAAACSPPSQPAKQAAAPQGTAVESLTERYISALPRWIPIGNQAGGGQIAYDIDGLKQDSAAGTVDITLQVTHAAPTTMEIVETGGTRVLTYQIERVTLRMLCAEELFAVASRRIVDKDGAVIHEIVSTPTNKDYKPIRDWPVAALAKPPACRT